MPSYSPSESQTPSSSTVMVGLSPNSQAAFDARDRLRNRIPDDDEFLFPDDDDEESSAESSSDPYSSDDDIFQFEDDFDGGKKKEDLRRMTLWYGNEEEMHIKSIFEVYEKDVSSSFACSHQTDSRRLPHFVGSIKRTPLKSDTPPSPNDVLSTLDEIGVYRRDIRQCGSTMTLVKIQWSLTTWDRDGLPRTFLRLSDEVARKKMGMAMGRGKIKENEIVLDPSYLYAFPVWESKTEFKYQGSTKKMDVVYANQPFNYTPFLPKEYFSDYLESDILV